MIVVKKRRIILGVSKISKHRYSILKATTGGRIKSIMLSCLLTLSKLKLKYIKGHQSLMLKTSLNQSEFVQNLFLNVAHLVKFTFNLEFLNLGFRLFFNA